MLRGCDGHVQHVHNARNSGTSPNRAFASLPISLFFAIDETSSAQLLPSPPLHSLILHVHSLSLPVFVPPPPAASPSLTLAAHVTPVMYNMDAYLKTLTSNAVKLSKKVQDGIAENTRDFRFENQAHFLETNEDKLR